MLKDIPFINQRENLYPSNFSLKTGYAGCLILESFLKKYLARVSIQKKKTSKESLLVVLLISRVDTHGLEEDYI